MKEDTILVEITKMRKETGLSQPVCSILWNTNKNVSKMGTERKYASSIYSGNDELYTSS